LSWAEELSDVCLRISSSLVDRGPTGELWRKSQALHPTEEQDLNISSGMCMLTVSKRRQLTASVFFFWECYLAEASVSTGGFTAVNPHRKKSLSFA